MIKKDFRVVNIVVSTSLGQKMPLEKLAANLSNTEYNPEQFPGLVMRLRNPKTSALIFNSGNVVCTGAKDIATVEKSVESIIETLKKVDIEIKDKPKIEVQNMVASGNFDVHINLNELAIKLPNTEYEPEQFPGLVYKLSGARATFLLFTNGKFVCTGTNTEKEADEAVDILIEKLEGIL